MPENGTPSISNSFHSTSSESNPSRPWMSPFLKCWYPCCTSSVFSRSPTVSSFPVFFGFAFNPPTLLQFTPLGCSAISPCCLKAQSTSASGEKPERNYAANFAEYPLQHQLDSFVVGPGSSSSPNARRIRCHKPCFT